MENRRDIAVKIPGQQAIEKILLIEIIGDLAIDQVAELVGAFQVVDGENPLLAALIERLDDIRSDESGSAGDDDIHWVSPLFIFGAAQRTAPSAASSSLRVQTAVPSFPTTMPAAILAT